MSGNTTQQDKRNDFMDLPRGAQWYVGDIGFSMDPAHILIAKEQQPISFRLFSSVMGPG
jgi:hypothetical protein